MSTATTKHPPIEQDALDAPVHRDDRQQPSRMQPGSQLWASNGRLWTVRAVHRGQRVELVADGPAGPVGMIVDMTAAARMLALDSLDHGPKHTDT